MVRPIHCVCDTLFCRLGSWSTLSPDPAPPHPHCGTGCALVYWWYIARMTRTVITILGACAIAARSLGGLELSKVQFFACWADVNITLGIIPELLRAKE